MASQSTNSLSNSMAVILIVTAIKRKFIGYFLFIAITTYIRTNQNPKEGGGAPRRHPLWGFIF